jgi:hypothetical protein
MVTEPEFLTGQEDAYDGLIIDPQTLPTLGAEFAVLLPNAIQVGSLAQSAPCCCLLGQARTAALSPGVKPNLQEGCAALPSHIKFCIPSLTSCTWAAGVGHQYPMHSLTANLHTQQTRTATVSCGPS